MTKKDTEGNNNTYPFSIKHKETGQIVAKFEQTADYESGYPDAWQDYNCHIKLTINESINSEIYSWAKKQSENSYLRQQGKQKSSVEQNPSATGQPTPNINNTDTPSSSGAVTLFQSPRTGSVQNTTEEKHAKLKQAYIQHVQQQLDNTEMDRLNAQLRMNLMLDYAGNSSNLDTNLVKLLQNNNPSNAEQLLGEHIEELLQAHQAGTLQMSNPDGNSALTGYLYDMLQDEALAWCFDTTSAGDLATSRQHIEEEALKSVSVSSHSQTLVDGNGLTP